MHRSKFDAGHAIKWVQMMFSGVKWV
jgi:hypothetical protein